MSWHTADMRSRRSAREQDGLQYKAMPGSRVDCPDSIPPAPR
ncbi:hypothetical protein [Noviherbaspirillum malthae]|nr:hypothetical protein [Noviherbaspirillum malthae]